jgi:hypothetical protein
MKLSLAITVLCAASALAQDQTAMISTASSACGPAGAHFDMKRDKAHHAMMEPEPAKALVYVIQDMGGFDVSCFTDCISTRVGLDGAWVGANEHNSYFFLSVDPGEHHLCVNRQSSLELYAHMTGLAHFTAEAGKTYYFRTRTLKGEAAAFLDIDPIDSDEAHYLITSYPLSISHPHK